MSKIFFGIMTLLFISLLSAINNPLRENNIAQLAIQTVRIQADLPKDAEIRMVEKRESPLPDFYMVKLHVVREDKEIPIVAYVDRSAEKVILGNLFIRGENITERETMAPDPRSLVQGLSNPEKPLFLTDRNVPQKPRLVSRAKSIRPDHGGYNRSETSFARILLATAYPGSFSTGSEP